MKNAFWKRRPAFAIIFSLITTSLAQVPTTRNPLAAPTIPLAGGTPQSPVQHQQTDPPTGKSFGCYPSETFTHTGCLHDSPPGCKITAAGVTAKDKAFIVKYHNQIRSMVATGPLPAARMMELAWDEELAVIAQKWANQCTFQNDCNECRSVPRFPVGQNVYGFVHWPDDGGTSNWTAAMEFWLDSGKNFTDDLIYEYQFQTPGGLYSQLIWGATHVVGCGYAKFGQRNWQAKHIYVCNYGPAGNMAGAPVYIPGTPCSHCPKGSTCVRKSLCRYYTSGPRGSAPGNKVPPPDPSPMFSGETPSAPVVKVGGMFGRTGDTSRLGIPDDNKEGDKPKPCPYTCIPSTFSRMCQVNTIISDADCSPDRICCALDANEITKSPGPMPPGTKKCPASCLRLDQKYRCMPGTIVTEPTNCGWGTVCCQLDSAVPEATSAPSVASAMMAAIDEGGTTPAHRYEYCPQEHACLPISMWSLCRHDTVISLAKNCSEADGRVCCQLAAGSATKTGAAKPVQIKATTPVNIHPPFVPRSEPNPAVFSGAEVSPAPQAAMAVDTKPAKHSHPDPAEIMNSLLAGAASNLAPQQQQAAQQVPPQVQQNLPQAGIQQQPAQPAAAAVLPAMPTMAQAPAVDGPQAGVGPPQQHQPPVE